MNKGIIGTDADLSMLMPPTTCGIDGANVVDRLPAVDMIACCAVATEELIPSYEEKHRENVCYRVFLRSDAHSDGTGIMLAGIMWRLELEFAAKAPHDVVFIDGSLTNPIIKKCSHT